MSLGVNSIDDVLSSLRAAADLSRLRLLLLCAQGEWTVSELTQILGQSQPRVSRHLKVLADAGLLERIPEGSWVFYRRARAGARSGLARNLCRMLPMDDPIVVQDRQRLAAVRETRRAHATRYFSAQAESWDKVRSLYVDEAKVESALLHMFDGSKPSKLLDIGTGTGRILALLAPHIGTGLGIDQSTEMLNIARTNLDKISLRNCQVRQGDMYRLPLADAGFDVATLHNVLHFADDPAAVLQEAGRVLRQDGRLIVIDFAPHAQEFLRREHAHRRLGFADGELNEWFTNAGLISEQPIVLDGDPLTVVLWPARRKRREETETVPGQPASVPQQTDRGARFETDILDRNEVA